MLIGQKNLYCILFFFNFFFFLCIYIYIYIYIIYIYVCVFVCIYICVCMYVYMYIYIYIWHVVCELKQTFCRSVFMKKCGRDNMRLCYQKSFRYIIKVNFNAFILSFSFLISLFCATLFLYFEFHMTLEHIFQEE